MYSLSPYYQNPINANPRGTVPPPLLPYIEAVVPKAQPLRTNSSVRSKVKMIDYQKLDTHKNKEGDGFFSAKRQ